MPYAKWADVNPAIRGIKPRVTLAMANHIADMADAIEKAGTAEAPWAVAIAQFKKEYKRSGGRWAKRNRRSREGGDMPGLREALDGIYWEEAEAFLGELTKKMGDRTHDMDDFLVHEDPKKPTTWHLPVKIRGKPNRRLAAGAWAALFSPEGYRGNPYDGPDKAGAKRRLKALYRAEDWEAPETGESAESVSEGSWYPAGDEPWPSVPYGAKSFADVEAAEETEEATKRMHALTYQFGSLAWNIMGDQDETDKISALRALADEYLALAEDVIGQMAIGGAPEAAREIQQPPGDKGGATRMEATEVEMTEVATGRVLRLVEDDPGVSVPSGSIVPMALDVAFIEPGWGNERDNHYYPAEMLRRDAGVFAGTKMYETDHREDEKSTRTWVSTIKQIAGFTETGAPVARVIVHDEDFAKRIKALAEAEMVEKMECSILAVGIAKKGKVEGREANVIERITSARSVDWVTRGGAGGRALGIAESEAEMKGYQLTFKIKGQVPKDDLRKHLDEALMKVGEGAEALEVVLAEIEPPAEPAPGSMTEPKKQPEPKPEPEPEPQAAAPTAEEVTTALAKTHLPQAAKDKLAAGNYKGLAELEAAIGRETEYVKVLTGSGRPFGLGPSRGPGQPATMTQEDYDKQMAEVLARHGVMA